jgi:hydrogenase expression/formation protein HypC
MCLGIPGQVVAIVDAGKQTGVVDVGGVRRVVNLALVRDKQQPISELLGTWLLIHVGFAMSRIDEAEAKRTLELLHDLGELVDRDVEREPAKPDAKPSRGR